MGEIPRVAPRRPAALWHNPPVRVDQTATVELRGGGRRRVRGSGTVGDRVFIRSGQIKGSAPVFVATEIIEFAHRIVEIPAIAPTVLDIPTFAGSQQGFVLGLQTPLISLAPTVKDVPGRQPVGMFPVVIAAVGGPSSLPTSIPVTMVMMVTVVLYCFSGHP